MKIVYAPGTLIVADGKVFKKNIDGMESSTSFTPDKNQLIQNVSCLCGKCKERIMAKLN